MHKSNKQTSECGNRVILVDDDPNVRELYELELHCAGFQCIAAESLSDLYASLKVNTVDLILLDNYLHNESGIEAIPDILKLAPNARVVVLTKSATPDKVVQAMKSGAHDFIVKGAETGKVAERLKEVLPSPASEQKCFSPISKCGMIGSSKEMLSLCEDIHKVAIHDVSVLVVGETGTGKELVANALHQLAEQRSKRPMLTVNCASLAPALLESELFGVKKGAFTDAKENRKGIFESAEQSTLFLDEIGELPLILQSKILRVIQEKEIIPIGSTKPIKINTRIVAATNRNLKSEVALGNFRDDLFFRLSVVTLHTPPLRDRGDDIDELALHFFDQMNKKYKDQRLAITSDQIQTLKKHSWPGNVRELKNVIERSVIMSDAEFDLKLESGPHSLLSRSSPLAACLDYSKYKLDYEYDYLKNLLGACNGNLTEAARISGLHRPSIYRMLKRLKSEGKPLNL